MAIAFIAPERKDIDKWQKSIRDYDPSIISFVYPNIPDDAIITSAAVWQQPPGILGRFQNLKWVSSLGAGVNHILRDESLGEKVVVTKIVDEELAADMAKFVASIILANNHDLFAYYEQQKIKHWHPLPAPNKIRIGILGLGNIGSKVATVLKTLDYEVVGFSSTPKQPDGITCYCGDQQFSKFLTDLDVLINLLPLTSATRGILNIELFKKLSKPAYLINVARGEHLVEEDLIMALSNNLLTGAWLDVFTQEPLPAMHPFWDHDKISISPHIASKTNPVTASRQLVVNYNNLKTNRPLINQVDRIKGY